MIFCHGSSRMSGSPAFGKIGVRTDYGERSNCWLTFFVRQRAGRSIMWSGTTSVPTLIEQIQLVIRNGIGILAGYVHEQTQKLGFLEEGEAQNL